MDASEEPTVAEEQPASTIGTGRQGWLRPWHVGLVVVSLAVAAILVVPRLARDDGMYRGPLSDPDVGRGFARSGVEGEPGEVVAIGIGVPYHDEGKPVLDRLLLVSPLPNLMVTEVGAAPCPLGAGRGTPREVCPGLRPVAGYTVLPGVSSAARVTLVVAFTTTGRRVTGFLAVVLEYHVGEASYRAIYLQGGSFCPAASCDETTLDEAQEAIRALAEDGSFDAIYDLAVPAEGQQSG